MGERWSVLVTLSHGDEVGPLVQVVVPVDDEDDLPTIDDRVERARATALDALRPFLNNRTHFDASEYLPVIYPAVAPTNGRGEP